ncbi:VENN motif pre-toxin domain-containing protein [Burkholderia ubonensis]|uniref:VENN motif pre-toxin domain-containing protein n=1 Tax=Burkholderia ubonensis TaxID=101571 RepID=UPI002FC92CCF
MTPGQAAAIAAFATFAGGAAAGLAGQNAAAGALAAQNETINNCLGHPESCTQLSSETNPVALRVCASWRRRALHHCCSNIPDASSAASRHPVARKSVSRLPGARPC